MPGLDDYKGLTPAWCPGCGNFMILKAFRETMLELGLAPHQFTIVSGIGQAGKFPHYIKCNTFNGLHGRSLPVATGVKLANHEMLVMAIAGDGDCYGEGGNHFMHAMRRNVGVKLFVHDNQVYGLTKGQASPTTAAGTMTKNQPFGVLSEQLNPMAMAVALDCSFVARTFAGDAEHLKSMGKASIAHKGFSLVDILQPCVSFNPVNTYDWYRQRVYHIEPDYNPEDRVAAFAKALEWGDRIPIGIIYRNTRLTMEERIPVIESTPLIRQRPDPARIPASLKKLS
ncbi:MAG TPA: 2-oxoacid:ferredoxin oxidoreductase subunit beta [Dissulfurispiraceae bacterium]|nr:2-oxoacid:ferredoxin oxidoreductase subunit beta [Dissulfurispiraceae bacterium]